MAGTDTIAGLTGLPAVQGYNHAVLLERMVLLLYVVYFVRKRNRKAHAYMGPTIDCTE
jgi:hypothetical protein